MSVHEKIFNVRNQFQEIVCKKTGNNRFAGFEYFELKDFLPDVLDLCKAQRLLGTFRVENGLASLTLVDLDEPKETVIFSAPFVATERKGLTDIQSIGASITYLRRYLWACVVELMDKDIVDAQEYKPKISLPKSTPPQEEVDLAEISFAFADCDLLEDLQRIYKAEYTKLKGNKEAQNELESIYKEHKARIQGATA